MKYLYLLFIIFLSIATEGQSIVGKWVAYNYETKEKKAVIEIYKTDHLYSAKIVESYVSENNATCETCKGKNKGKPIIDLTIIENIKQDGDEFNGGTILDPENGETYKCYLQLIDNNKLKVRGYLGLSLLGRTQYWTRYE